LQILLLAQHVSDTTMPIIRSSRILYSGCYLWYLVLWFSSCWSGVELRVIIIIIIIIIINCNWVVTRWQLLIYMNTNMKKKVTRKFKSGGLHETHVVATWKLGNHLCIRLYTQGNQEKPVSRWPVAGPSGY